MRRARRHRPRVSRPPEAADEDLETLFYTDAAAFERERAVLHDPAWVEFAAPALRAALPESADAPPLLANGLPLPPAIVRVSGDSVRDWARAAAPDGPMTSQTLLALAALLERLHGAGLVHRDVRPESLRWLPQRLEWALVNFGFSATARAPSPSAVLRPPLAFGCFLCECFAAVRGA